MDYQIDWILSIWMALRSFKGCQNTLPNHPINATTEYLTPKWTPKYYPLGPPPL